MSRYLLRRLGYAIVTFAGITIATFTLIHSVPGDPVTFFLGRGSTGTVPQEAVDAIRRKHHLDRPLPVQYLYWFRGIVTLDLGDSIIEHRPVADLIFEKLPNTFQLNVSAFLLAALIGVPIGFWSATKSGRPMERASAVLFFLLYSLPSFWVALLLMQWLSVRLGVLPLFGMSSDYPPPGVWGKVADRMQHLVLPVLTLAYAQMAIFARFSKAALTEVIGQDYITAARARGATEGRVLWGHAFRNALIPLITLLGLTIPYLISGSVIVEQIFQWDGVGLLYYDAILARDYPVIMGLTVATALITLFAGILADVLYAIADPRVRLGEGA